MIKKEAAKIKGRQGKGQKRQKKKEGKKDNKKAKKAQNIRYIASISKPKKVVMKEIYEEITQEDFSKTPLICIMDGSPYLWDQFGTVFKDISNKQAITRSLGYIPSTLLLGLGFLIIIFRKDKRSLHDLLANTAVIHTKL